MMKSQPDLPPRESLLEKGSPYIEGILGVAGIVVINLLWYREDPGFIQTCPHPFWLIILLIATHYGFKGALWTAFLSSATLLAFHKMTQPYESIVDMIGVQRLTTPVLFMVVGVIVGEIRELHKRRFLEVNVELADLKRDFVSLSDRFNDLDKVKQELDTRIILQEHGLTTLYWAAEGLRSLDEENIYPAILRLAKDLISAESCSIYLLEGNILRQVACLDGDGICRRTDVRVPPDEGIMGRAISTAETVSINTLMASEEFEGYSDSDILVSAPMINSRNQILGLLNIQKIPFLKFTPQAVRLTAILADWGAVAVENARIFQETKDKNISDDVTGIFTYEYFKTRLDEEFARARRYHLPLSILVIHVVEFQLFTDKVKKDVLLVLSNVFRTKMRKTDLLFHSSNPDTFYLLLPNTGLKGANDVREKKLHEIHALRFKPYTDSEKLLQIHIRIGEVKETMEAPQELLDEAQK